MNQDINQLKQKINNYYKSLSFKDALEEIIKEVCLFTGWPYGEVWLPEKENKYVKYYTSWDGGNGRFDSYKEFSEFCKFGKGIGLIGSVWEKNKPEAITDLLSDKFFLRVDAARKNGLKSVYAFPIVINGINEGVAAFYVTAPKEEDKDFFKLLNEIFYLTN